jgi:ElaB/YqjD/DUF883 family membrane-anchored ribosome-binding protein
LNPSTYSPSITPARQAAEDVADSVAAKAHDALIAMSDKVEEAGRAAPSVFSRAAAQVDELTRQGLLRAQEARSQIKDQVQRAGDASRGYIRDEPVKSVLIAAATGAAVAALVSLLVRGRKD